MLELYYLEEADSICSNRVLMTLKEKGISDWVPHKMILMQGDQFKKEYLAINPKAQVPTLVHDGVPIRESSIICSYLDDIRPENPLKPADHAGRAHLQEWVKDSDEYGYQAAASINFVTKFRLSVPIEKMEERWKKVTDIDRIHRQQSCVRHGYESPYTLRAVGHWDRIIGKMDEALSDGRSWIMGDQLTLAETLNAPLIKVLEMLRLLHLWAEGRPHFQDWWSRVTQRPSYAQFDTFPGQATDDSSAHAIAGREGEADMARVLVEYREMMAR